MVKNKVGKTIEGNRLEHEEKIQSKTQQAEKTIEGESLDAEKDRNRLEDGEQEHQ